MATPDRVLIEGKLHIKQNKFGKRWRRSYVLLYPDSAVGVARLEIYDWKDGSVDKRKAADRKIIRLAECIHVSVTSESGHKDNMAAFTIETSERSFLLSTERNKCDQWVQSLSQAAFPGNCNDGKPGKERAESLEMAINSIYFSRELATEFWVTVQRTEAAERCSLRGSYILRAESDSLILKDPDTKESLYSWPYKLLRRYGRDKVMFSFEAGRRCASGSGNFTFETSQGHEIFQKVECSIRAQQGSEKRLSGLPLEAETPVEFSCQTSDSDMSDVSVLALRKDMEEKVLKGRVLPSLPAVKAAQPPHLLEPLIPGKSGTPPRSPVSHHSSDSEHLSVYSEPKDSVTGVRPHFDPLYSDPVDSMCNKDVRPNKEKAASPLYSDLYEQVRYEVVGGEVSSKILSTSNVPPGSEEHIYDEPEGIVRITDTPQLYSEVQMEAAAWRKHASDEKLGYEYPYNLNIDDYSIPNIPGQRNQARTRTGPKPVPAPKPQGIILPKPPGKERDPENTPVIHSNSNNNNANLEALYSQVIKPGNAKSTKPQPSQSAPPLLPIHQLQSVPPLPPVHQLQSVPPLPLTLQSQSALPLPLSHQSQSAPPLPLSHQSQSAPPLPPVHQSQSAPPLPLSHQSQSAPPLPLSHQSQSAPPLPPINQSQSAPPLPLSHKSQSAPPLPPMNKPQSSPPVTPAKPPSTQPISVKTLPLTVPERSKPSPGTDQTPQSLPEPHAGVGFDPQSGPQKDISVIYEDMGFL